MTGLSGRRVVLVILASLGVVTAVVLAGYLLFEPTKAPCATGEAAENEFINGAYVPRREYFDRVEDAEAFICHDVPELHHDAWRLETISAERSHALAQTVDGNGSAAVYLTYRNEDRARTLVLDATPFFTQGGIPQPFTERDVTFGAYSGKLIRGGINPALVTVIWVDGNLQVRVVAQTDSAFTEEQLLEVLATTR